MLSIRLFGPLELTANGRRLGPRDLGGLKPKQLLEILLVHRGHAVAKEQIADQLWGQAQPQNVSATLETYVWLLRRQLDRGLGLAGRVLLTESGAYRFDRQQADIDLDRFDALVVRGRRRDLDEALALVRGEVLEDEPYSSWALRLREQYRERHLQALLAAAGAALQDGDHAVAQRRAAAAIDRDPVREQGYRLLMLACYTQGRQDEALRAFERCREALAEELGVDPLPQTLDLHTAILRHEDPARLIHSAADRSSPAVRVSSPVTDLPLLGRTEELQALERGARAALAGQAGILLVEGEAGIGKSRLLDELAARLTGCRIGRAKCFELDPDLPFVPLAAALRAAGASQVAAANPTSVAALGEILPELGPSGLPAEAARARALESLAALVGQLEPLALVIDDLQWVDPSTIGALVDLCRRRAAMPLVVVGAFRSEEVPSDHPVRALDATLHLDVEPLTPDDVAPLGITGLHERTGGNPLFVVERLRAATEGTEDQIPDTLRDLIVARCRRAGADAHRLLVVASVVGRSFTPSLLMEMTGSHPAGLTPELEALCERRLLQRAAGGFDFRHDLIRQALYQSLSAESRIALHGRALRALEATGSDAGQLVHHALQAGALELAVRYATDAGDAARARWANIEAVAQYQRAREIADGHPGLLEAPALEALLLRLGRVLVTTGRTPDAEKSIHRARASAERRGDQQALFEALDGLAFARQRGASDPRGSLHHATAALEVAESIGDHVLLSRAHTMVGSPSGSLGLIDQALEHSEQAISHARAAGLDPPAYPMGRIAFMLRHRGRDTEVIDWTSRAEAAALTEHDEETLLMARWVRALALTDLGRHREAWQTLDSIADIGKGEEVFWHARVPNTYGSILADLGLFDRALDRDLESLEVARSSTAMPIREAELQTLLNLGADYLGLGRTAEARAQLEAVRRQADKVEYGRFRWLNRLQFLDAEVALVEGDAERGRVAADRCLELAATYGQAKYEVRGKMARARALAALGARPTALLEARAAGQLAAQLSFPGLAWRAWWLAHGLSGAPQDRQRAQAEAMRIATGLDDDLRSAFLAAIPVQP